MDVKVYALSTCPYCKMSRKFLDEHSVEYDVVEVDTLEGDSQDPATPKGEAIAEVRKISGGASFPVIIIGDEVIVGFNKVRVQELLGL